MTTPKQTPVSSGELMPDNYVSCNCLDGLITTVKSVSRVGLSLDCNPMAKYSFGDVSGIPITPGILKSVGAKPMPYPGQWDYEIPVGAIKFNFRFNADRCYSEFGGIYFGDHFKYLHQIQNMVALTGSHLKVQI